MNIEKQGLRLVFSQSLTLQLGLEALRRNHWNLQSALHDQESLRPEILLAWLHVEIRGVNSRKEMIELVELAAALLEECE